MMKGFRVAGLILCLTIVSFPLPAAANEAVQAAYLGTAA